METVTKQKFKIKISQPSDFVKICKLYKQLLDFPLPINDIWFKDANIIKQKIKKQEVIIATNKNKLLGHLSFKTNPWSIEIDTLIVDKKYRGNGIGTTLVEFFVDRVGRDKKYSIIKVGSYKCFDCKDFYVKMGFQLKPKFEFKDTWEFIKEL